jgi:NAD(P)-dependent dehydrogenase (short-subunit alcohol dehydrogenase family)
VKGLAGKRVIVTGAARGIGRSIATRFASEDCHVLIADIKADALAETTAELKEIGRVESVVGDVASPEFCESLVREAEQRLGGVDVVINNAGIVAFEPFLEHTAVEWERTLAINLTAVFRISQAAARVMVAQGTGGVILSMASANGHVPEHGIAAYNVSKGGVILLTKSMAIELAPHHIRANCISPGYIGPMTGAMDGGASEAFIQDLPNHVPAARFGAPEEVAALYAFLASEEAPFITGESVVIDGGQLSIQR